MGISFGSNSMKPYVGGKEVQEAYAGSQLVYRATPPYVYAFLGGENDYLLADWCTLANGTAVVKSAGVYRIAMGSEGGQINLSEVHGEKLKFLGQVTGANARLTVSAINNSGATLKQQSITIIANAWNLYEFDLSGLTNLTRIQFTNPGYSVIRADAIRYED